MTAKELEPNVSDRKVIRLNLWLANRLWIAVTAFAIAVTMFSASILLLVASVHANTASIEEFRYRSCIEDSVVDLTVKQGQLIDDAFSQDRDASTRDLIPYRDALDALRETKKSCRAQFPE